MRHTKKEADMLQNMFWGKKSIKSDSQEACTMLDLIDKDFKSVKGLKETMPTKQLKFENSVSGNREYQ